jgi:uncharacterized protein involved in exopolysaccharide biosynthesis
VKILGVERSAAAVAQWREATKAKIPLERYFADVLARGLAVGVAGGSNVVRVSFTAQDPIFAQAAANAFAQAYMDVSVELRVAPARQSAVFLEEQSKAMLGALEQAQSRLSKFQQSKGIVATDERLSQENARYTTLLSQLAMAQSEAVSTSTLQRNTGAETSPDVLQSGQIGGLKAQLASAQTKLTQVSGVLGKNHPDRQQLEAQVGELQRQIAAETRRIAGGASVLNRGSGQKIADLQALAEEQKKQLLALRSERDQIANYARDVDIAQRNYDAVSQRLTQLNLEGQNSQANTRLLSAAVEPLEPSRPKIPQGILASLLAGIAAGIAAALALEAIDRRVRSPEDLLVASNVPVLGVLRPTGSRRPVVRRLLISGVGGMTRPALAGPGMRS